MMTLKIQNSGNVTDRACAGLIFPIYLTFHCTIVY